MNVAIRPVELPNVYRVWDRVEPFLKSAEQKYENPEYNTHHIKAMLTSGQWVLLVFVDENNEIQGALTLSFVNYPNDRVAFVTAVGGKLLAEDTTADQLADICRAYGATTIHGVVNKSIARLCESKLGFKERAILVERRL